MQRTIGRAGKIDFERLARRVYREFTGNPRKALALAEKGLEEADRRKNLDGAARMTLARAHALRECGRLTDALRAYDTAARLFRRLGRTQEAWRTCIGKLDALDQMGRYTDALALARQAHRYFRKAGLPLWAAKVDANTGNIYQHLDRYPLALKSYQRAFPILSVEQPIDGQVLLFNQATTYLCSGNPGEAIQLLERCLRFFESQNLPAYLARTHYNIAYGYYLLGKYQDALAHLREARSRMARLRDWSFLASCSLDESELYLRLNRTEEALRRARLARARFIELKMPYEAAESNALLGIGMLRSDRVAEAIPFLKQAQSFFSRRRNAIKSAELDSHLAFAFLKRGDRSAALRFLRHANGIFMKHRLYSRLLSTSTYIAGIQHEMDRAREAHATLLLAQSWTRHVMLPWVLQSYYQMLGKVETRLAAPGAAKHLGKAIRLTETMRSEIPAEDLRISFFQDKLAAFDELIRVGLRAGTPRGAESAFLTAERARSQVLLDLLEGSLQYRPDDAEGARLFGQLTALRNDSWRRSIGASAGDGSETRERQVERKILLWMRKSQSSRPSMEQDRLSLREIRQAIRPDQAIVSFYVTNNEVHAFVLDAENMTAYPSLAGIPEILPAWQFVRFQMERARIDRSISPDLCNPHLDSLSVKLLGPLLSRLRGRRLWTIIPHGPLHAFPFHCLRDAQGFLIDRHTFSYAPSASVYLHCRNASSRRSAVGLFGHSDEMAPLIDREIDQLRLIFPEGIARTGPEASGERLQTEAPNARILHIAAHGRFLREQPFSSGLLLADGWFTLPQVYRLKLNAHLVTLSGCETGGGEVAAGDELLGLVRGFLYAGAASLLVSLWRVADESTAFFMREFYSALTGGHGLAESWRRTMLATRERWPHPYHWAPFFLVGKP